MKVIIQIPCLNEEFTLPATVAALPREIPGVDEVEFLIIDDGSTDRTSEVAAELGVDHILRHTSNQGLGRSFRSGLDAAVMLGADVIVNTDGDGQYRGSDIPALVAPILENGADIVIGDRKVASSEEFGLSRKLLHWLGSVVVRSVSGYEVPDAVSGFRAISRQAAFRLNILSKFSYTVEMIIQASNKQMTVLSVPVGTNPKTRESRLFRSVPQFVSQQLAGMIRMYAMYRPMQFFFCLGILFSVAGVIPVLRFLYFYFAGDGSGNIQSLVLGGALITMGFMLFLAGLIADLISHNRQLTEIALEKVRAIEVDVRAAQETVGDRQGIGEL